jgi:hypothetical protein
MRPVLLLVRHVLTVPLIAATLTPLARLPRLALLTGRPSLLTGVPAACCVTAFPIVPLTPRRLTLPVVLPASLARVGARVAATGSLIAGFIPIVRTLRASGLRSPLA